jgi:N-acetylglucosamine-6-phosphate deacetylase
MRIDENVGSIEEGKFADFVIMDNDLTVKQVYVNGIS